MCAQICECVDTFVKAYIDMNGRKVLLQEQTGFSIDRLFTCTTRLPKQRSANVCGELSVFYTGYIPPTLSEFKRDIAGLDASYCFPNLL